MNTHTHIHIPYTFIHSHTHTPIHTYTHTPIYMHTHTHIHTHIYPQAYAHVHIHINTYTHKYIHSHINIQTHRASNYGIHARLKDPGRGNGKNQGENYMRQHLTPNKKAMEYFPSSLGYFLQVCSDPKHPRMAGQISLSQMEPDPPGLQAEPAAVLPKLPST